MRRILAFLKIDVHQREGCGHTSLIGLLQTQMQYVTVYDRMQGTAYVSTISLDGDA